MALTTTNAQFSIQDGQGAVTNLSNGNNGIYTPGALLTVALQSTTGVASAVLTLICPSFPSLHGRQIPWFQGQANLFQIQMPAYPASSAGAQAGVQLVMSVCDGLQSIAQSVCTLQTRNWACVPMQHFVRGVIATALAAYTNVNGVITANANGALAANDGVTYVAGDLVLLPDGIAATAVDAGIYQVTSAGGASAKFVLTAAPDWQIGAQVMPKTEILASEGTLYGGTTWVVTKTGLTNTVGTTNFTFVPRQVTQSITLVAGTATISNVPVSSATKTNVVSCRTTANTSTATTGGYHPVGAMTPGALGTASITFDATVAAGTINNADVSTLAVTVINPV